MKIHSLIFLLSFSHYLFASPESGIVCREDLRFDKGPLREVVLSPNENGGYFIQSQYVPSLHSPNIEIEMLAENAPCQLDGKSPLAFCKNESGQSTIQFIERREVYYDTLEEDAKRKTDRFTDIVIKQNGETKRTLSFSTSHCQAFNKAA